MRRRSEHLVGFACLLLVAACSPKTESSAQGERVSRNVPDCPTSQLSCGKQTPVRSNGKDAFVNEDMGIRVVFPEGSEVCLTRSGDAPRGFFMLLESVRNPCSENPDRKAYLSIDSNFNSSFHKTLIETAHGECDPLPSGILKYASARDFSIPGHRVLVCGERSNDGTGVIVYAMGGGTTDSGEGLVEAIEYRATLGTTEQRAKEDVATFREFLSSLELGNRLVHAASASTFSG